MDALTPELHIMLEPHNGATYDDQLAVATLAESLGFHGVFRADHYLSGVPDGARGGITDTWTTLAGLARETSTITLGSLVSSATFRLPAALAVIVAQVDAMSGGRVELGLGAGWWPAEHSAMGIPFPSTAERFDRLVEQLDIVTGLWRTAPDERFSYAGAH